MYANIAMDTKKESTQNFYFWILSPQVFISPRMTCLGPDKAYFGIA